MKKINFLSLVVFTIILTSCGGENSTQNTDKTIDCGFVDMGFGVVYAPSFYNYVDDGSYKNQPDGEYTIQIKGKFTKGDFIKEDINQVQFKKYGNVYSPKYEFGYGSYNMDDYKEINTQGPAKAQCSFSSIIPK
jgi:hypothetical protein